jgi:drug/metabolite transporter (DMT)-like permease
LNELPASTVGTYAYVNPVVAVALGAVLLGEALTPGLLVGGVLILVAVLLSTLRPRGGQAARREEKDLTLVQEKRLAPSQEG